MSFVGGGEGGRAIQIKFNWIELILEPKISIYWYSIVNKFKKINSFTVKYRLLV